MLLHHRFVETAKQYAQKTAISDRSVGKSLTYRQTLIASLILTRICRKFPRGNVGLMVPTSLGCILAKIAILMSGRTPVMINYSTGAEQNARFAQRKCAFHTIITSKALLEKINCPHVPGMIYLEEIMAGLSWLDKLWAAGIALLPANLIKLFIKGGDEDDNLVLLFTSGSEREPKTVPLTHKNITTNIVDCGERFHFTDQDILLATLPYFHVFGMTVNLWLPLFYGSTIVCYANPLEYKKVCEIARKEKTTVMVGTPSFYWGYLRKSELGDFTTTRIAMCGADKCPDALREGFMSKHGVTLLEGYGATECSPVISVNSAEENRPGSVGKPVTSIAVRIENYETGEECAPGEDGRILVKGPSVMKGYFNDFEQTSLRMRHGWYDTGDMGNIDADGYLWHVGRLKRFIKIGGEMISLVRTENVLEKLLPEDIECCVIEVPDAIKGAKIVAVTTAPIEEKTIIKQLAGQLPAIAIPKIFLVRQQMPKTGNGKIDFRALTEIARQELQR
ncbi:MAG: AMP-binding protein [Desulfobulbaceae bacterium]|jgi:acyl-[acyl-carrier-protein]-phospholipid O-acyltransferase/long-chain-fatty-acid--[acyl-carrier-protein] ligase|nr:AMP-binding protein [Desulfobulbaceae bacterium]